MNYQTTGDLAFRPFPAKALPQPIRQFMKQGAAAIGCDRSFVALPMLSTLAAAIGSTRVLQLKAGWNAPAIVWTAIIGESGAAKSPAFDLVTDLLAARQNRQLEPPAIQSTEEMLADLERIAASVTVEPSQPEPTRYFVSDATIEAIAPILKKNPRGVLLCRDELSGWLTSFSRAGSDASNWLSLFNGKSLTVDRKTGDQPTIHVPRGYVSVTGGIQPSILRDALKERHRESGLAARILFALPPAIGKRWSETTMAPSVVTATANVINGLYDLQFKERSQGAWRAFVCTLTDKAKKLFIDQFDRHNAEQASLGGDLSRAWAKLEEYPARFALIFHCVRVVHNDPSQQPRDPLIIDAASMRCGITIAEWFKHEAKRVYHHLNETPEQRLQRELIDWIRIKKNGRATVREIQRGRAIAGNADEIEKLLNQIAARQLGYWKRNDATQRGNQVADEFVLHQKFPDTETQTTCDSNR